MKTSLRCHSFPSKYFNTIVIPAKKIAHLSKQLAKSPYQTPFSLFPLRACAHVAHGVHVWLVSVVTSELSSNTFYFAPFPSPPTGY